jgi:hypothetical protein
MADDAAVERTVTCATCAFYEERHANPELLAQAASVGHPFPPGHCRRYPQLVLKRPDEWCGEFARPPEERLR